MKKNRMLRSNDYDYTIDNPDLLELTIKQGKYDRHYFLSGVDSEISRPSQALYQVIGKQVLKDDKWYQEMQKFIKAQKNGRMIRPDKTRKK